MRGGIGHGFLDQEMFAGFEQRLGDFEMGDGGGDDAEKIGGGGGGLDGIERADFVFGGDALGGGGRGIENAGEFELAVRLGSEIGKDAGVLLAEGAGTDDSSVQSVDHGPSILRDGSRRKTQI